MRLIDAEALETKQKTIYMEFENVAVPTKVISVTDLYLAPSVDAEPVRHGQNVTYTHPSDMFICSECGFSCEITELRYDDGMGKPDAYEYECKFCPECGAKIGDDENAAN